MLRALQGVLGGIEIVAAVIAILLIVLLPVAIDKYAMCFYTMIGTPSVFLPLLFEFGCPSPAWMAITALLLHGFVYRIVFMTLFSFQGYYRSLIGGKYNNPYRWTARGAVYPIYFLIAYHASGGRDFVTASVFMIIVFAVEMFRWITERKRQYNYSRSRQLSVISESGRSAFYASVLFAIIVVASQLAYWIIYIAQAPALVQLMTWIYGITFLVSYLVFSIWTWIIQGRVEMKYGERMNVEYAWEIFQTIVLLLLTAFAILGSVYV